MIIQFTIGNFLSFKEQSTLSLVASALKEIQVPAEDIIFNVGTSGLSLMKSAVVYGANASGKSNFIKALEFFKWYVINSSKDIQAGERVNIESFRLNLLRTNQVILKQYSVMKITNIVMDLKLIIHWYIRNGFIKKPIKRELRKLNYSIGKKIILIFILSLSLVKNLQVNEW